MTSSEQALGSVQVA